MIATPKRWAHSSLVQKLLDAYRRTGADPPFGDPLAAHGVAMEGWYWRLTDAASGRVVVALCGVCRPAAGETWALVALAAHPDGPVREEIVSAPTVGPEGLAVGSVLRAGPDRLELRLGGDVIDARLHEPTPWPRRAFGGLGPAGALPGLSQYWHPHLLGARVEGRASLGGEEIDLGGATAYGEKNWGAGFPDRWWWGQAHGFDRSDACIAFAGGQVALGSHGLGSASAIVVRVGEEVARLGLPGALVSASADGRGWRLRGRGPRYAVELEGESNGTQPHRLPVPIPDERRSEPRAEQYLAGLVRVELRRGRRTVWRDSSPLAGLESGTARG